MILQERTLELIDLFPNPLKNGYLICPGQEAIQIEPLFRIKRRCRVYLNNTIRLKKRSFEVMDSLPGQRLDIWFMPWNLDTVWYGPDMKPAKPVDPTQNAQRRQICDTQNQI